MSDCFWKTFPMAGRDLKNVFGITERYFNKQHYADKWFVDHTELQFCDCNDNPIHCVMKSNIAVCR